MKQFNEQDEIEIDLVQIAKVLMSKIVVILAAGILLGIVALFVSKVILTPKYESTSKLYIINRQNEGQTTYSDIQSSTQLVKDYKVLVTSTPVVEKVISTLALDRTIEKLVEQITVSIESDSRVLEIKVIDQDPYTAKYITDALADISSDQITTVMKIEGVNVIEYGRVATTAAQPNTGRNVLIATMLGILISCAAVVIAYVMDDSIKSSDDIERYLGLSTLSLIPLSDEEKQASKYKRKILKR